MKKVFAAVLALGMMAAAVTGCDPESTYYRDYLNATVHVKASDGTSPVADLPVETYDWIINFTDGSQVIERFQDSRFVTGADGGFSFKSEELDLYSGREYSSCTTVCVEWTTYCEEYCVEWDEDGYCTWYETSCSDYCSLYGQDCDYYYPARSVSQIESAWTEISYYLGNSLVTTPSETVATPATAFSSTSAPYSDNDTLVEKYWNQNDVFITPISGSSVQKPARSKLARKPIARPAAKILKASELNAKQLERLDAVRKSWGATKR